MHRLLPQLRGLRAARLWLSVLLACSIWLPVRAQYDYRVEEGGITLLRYTGDAGVVDIPSTLDGLPVRTIGAVAFRGRTNVTSVLIPDTVTRIGTNAFLRCTRLTQFSIPASVVIIEDGILSECTALSGIVVSPDNPSFTSQDGVLFDKTLVTLKQFPGGVGGNYTVPASVRELSPMAFAGCTSLTGITIPTGVTTLGRWLFAGCVQLAEVHLPSGITRIPDDAFRSCVRLGSMALPEGVTEIGSLAFHGCLGLTNVVFPEGLTTLGLAAFADCSALTEVSLPASVTAIGNDAFEGATNLVAAYFLGNAPTAESLFPMASPPTVYYLPGTTGWTGSFGGAPTAEWAPVAEDSRLEGDVFSASVSGPVSIVVVLEARSNLESSAPWRPVSTNTIPATSRVVVSDTGAGESPMLVYRVRVP